MQTPDEETSHQAFGAGSEGERETSQGSEATPTQLNGTAAYIADITKELSVLARGSGLETLAYVLDIAQLEAAAEMRRRRRASAA